MNFPETSKIIRKHSLRGRLHCFLTEVPERAISRLPLLVIIWIPVESNWKKWKLEVEFKNTYKIIKSLELSNLMEAAFITTVVWRPYLPIPARIPKKLQRK